MRPESSRAESATNSGVRDRNFRSGCDGFAELNHPHGFDDGTFFTIAPFLSWRYLDETLDCVGLDCLFGYHCVRGRQTRRKEKAGRKSGRRCMDGRERCQIAREGRIDRRAEREMERSQEKLHLTSQGSAGGRPDPRTDEEAKRRSERSSGSRSGGQGNGRETERRL